MPELFKSNIGAVRIYPKDKGPHRGPKLDNVPDGWQLIEASRYVRRGSITGRPKTGTVADVVKSGRLDDEKPVLIIVHMRPLTIPATEKKKKRQSDDTLNRQAAVIRAAVERRLPIYVTQRPYYDNSQGKQVRKKPVENPDAIRNTLPPTLKKEIQNYPDLYYFDGLEGNAITGEDYRGRTLEAVLEDLHVNTAIVFGMALGQCIDSTILGIQKSESLYYRGLLDLKIDVVTARNILLPSDEVASKYFEFAMREDITFGLPTSGSAPPSAGDQSESAQHPSMKAATGFAETAAIIE